MAEIEIRGATAEDAEAIGEAHSEAWRVAYAELFPAEFLALAVAERLERWPRYYADGSQPPFETYVPVLDGRVVGFSTVRPAAVEGASMGEVLGFYLHPAAWGSGAAWELMQHSLNGFRNDGYGSAHLWTHPEAIRANAFYRKASFELTGRAQTGLMISGYDPVPTVELFRDL